MNLGRRYRPRSPSFERDVFLCHASEDKQAVARPLANALRRRGLRVWYDEFELRLGDSLRKRIDEGLGTSRYGVVILSRAFFSKEWPQRELDGLLALETDEKKILPVWHGVDSEAVRRYSPILAGRLGISISLGTRKVAEAVLSAVRGVDTASSSAKGARVTSDGRKQFSLWSGIARHSSSGGYWCSVVGLFGSPAARFLSPEKRRLVDAVGAHFRLGQGDTDLSLGSDVVEISRPAGSVNKDFIARFGTSGAASLQCAGNEPAVPLQWFLSSIHRALRCLQDERVRNIYSGLDQAFVCLSNLPELGVATGDFLPPEVGAHREWTVKGMSVFEFYGDSTLIDPLNVVAHFASEVLAKIGYLDYEEPLARRVESKGDFRIYLERE